MRTYRLDEARAEFSELVRRALKGEPQRDTRSVKGAGVSVPETIGPKSTPSRADLFLKHATDEGYDGLLDQGAAANALNVPEERSSSAWARVRALLSWSRQK